MTAQIHAFPVPATFRTAARDRRVAIVAAARAILRSAANHDDATLSEAAIALMEWGNPQTDWWEGYHVQRAVHLRAKARALATARRGRIRAALADCAGLAVIIALALAAYLAGP